MSQPKLQPDYQQLPLSGQRPQKLVLLLHGVGASGLDLFSLARDWGPLLPEAEFISPNAPFPFDGGVYEEGYYPHSYQWFSIKDVSLPAREARLREAIPILDRFLDELLLERSLTEADLAVVGFSQGAIMGMFTTLQREVPVGAMLAYSGRLAGAESVRRVMRSRPRTMLVHGTEDEVIPVTEFHESTRILTDLQVPLLSIPLPGVGHAIPEDAQRLGGHFLQRCLTEPDWLLDTPHPLGKTT